MFKFVMQAEKEEQAVEKAPAAKDEQEQWIETQVPIQQPENINDWAAEAIPVTTPAPTAPFGATEDWSTTATSDWSAAAPGGPTTTTTPSNITAAATGSAVTMEEWGGTAADNWNQAQHVQDVVTKVNSSGLNEINMDGKIHRN